MYVEAIEIGDLRNIASARFTPSPTGATVLWGPNGSGKTSVLEAIGLLSTGASLRGVPHDALVRRGSERGFVRAAVVHGDGRRLDVDAELTLVAPPRLRVNGKRVQRRRDLSDALATVAFTPEHAEIVRGGPGGRRDFLDDVLVTGDRVAGGVVEEFERVLRQRNALLRSAKGRLDAGTRDTLAVWDDRFDQLGTELAERRVVLVAELGPHVQRHYDAIAGERVPVRLAYEPSYAGRLADAVGAARDEDVRRGVTTVGPHRDELALEIDGMAARTHASQGEQRSLALAMILGAHDEIARRRGDPPVLLLDDVFSELDPTRAAGVLGALGATQTIVTSTAPRPPGVDTGCDVAIAEVVTTPDAREDGP